VLGPTPGLDGFPRLDIQLYECEQFGSSATSLLSTNRGGRDGCGDGPQVVSLAHLEKRFGILPGCNGCTGLPGSAAAGGRVLGIRWRGCGCRLPGGWRLGTCLDLAVLGGSFGVGHWRCDCWCDLGDFSGLVLDYSGCRGG